jgi:hypothetical protein
MGCVLNRPLLARFFSAVRAGGCVERNKITVAATSRRKKRPSNSMCCRSDGWREEEGLEYQEEPKLSGDPAEESFTFRKPE